MQGTAFGIPFLVARFSFYFATADWSIKDGLITSIYFNVKFYITIQKKSVFKLDYLFLFFNSIFFKKVKLHDSFIVFNTLHQPVLFLSGRHVSVNSISKK